MSCSITSDQEIIEALNIKAAMWAHKIMTGKLNNEQCKYEIAQKIDDANDMQNRVRKYLSAGLITDETFKTAAQEQVKRIRQQAKASPASTQTSGGSKDGLWSKNIKRKN